MTPLGEQPSPPVVQPMHPRSPHFGASRMRAIAKPSETWCQSSASAWTRQAEEGEPAR